MIGKGLLMRRERFGVHVYEAGIPKEETQTQILSDLLDRAFEGSASNLVMRALAAKPASPKELAGIRDMIESARKKRGSSE
jgi:BlaI family transcriptional regulator, penicillinase repressor